MSNNKFKVILVGESGVGKTCIIKQYIENSFDSEEIPTIAGQEVFKEIQIGKETVKLTVWDTCGQEQFRSINSIFMKKSNIVIFVYDITDQKSFDELKNYWCQEVKSSLGEDVVFAVAGNKSDLYEDQKISAEEGQEFADSINAYFKETTATDNEVITELFYHVAEVCLKKKLGNNKIDDNSNSNNNGNNDSGSNDNINLNNNNNNTNNNNTKKSRWC